jgi:scyllo-inositol 2-dehydrogenase (NADP+)
MTTPVSIGLVGLGWVALHRHLPALRRDPRFRVVGLADRHGDLAAHWARRLGIPHHCQAERIDQVGWLDAVDAVDVVTAPMAHHALVRDALLAGKHVVTEKPFAMTVAQGEELVALARARGRRLAIVHNFQFASSTLKLLADLDRGRLGIVRSIVAVQWGNPQRRLPAWYEELPAGLFFDESPHLLYLVRRLAPGALRLVAVDSCASTLGLRTPATVDASYRAAGPHGEIPVHVSCRFEAPLSEWHVAVLGDRAAGIVDVFRDIYLRLPNDGRHGSADVLRTSWRATAMHWARHLVNGPLHLSGRLLYGNATVFERFAQAIESGADPVGTGPDDALAVLRMQHDIVARVEPAAGVPRARDAERQAAGT